VFNLKRIKILLLSGFIILISTSCTSFQYKDELVKAYYNLGNSYMELGKLKESELVLARAVRIDPSFYSAAYNLGIVQILSGEYKKGITSLKSLLEKQPENTLVLKVLAWGYYKNGDSSQAIEVYRKILGMDAFNKDVLNNISILLMNQKMYSEAYSYMVQIEKLGNADGNLLYNLGVAERELSISSGLSWFESAYKKNPKLEKNIIAYIDALKLEHNFKKIISLYDYLITINPDPSYLFDKAFILLTSIEDYENGLPVLESALKKGYSDLDRIEELKEYPDLLNKDKILSIILANPVKTLSDDQVSPLKGLEDNQIEVPVPPVPDIQG